MNESDLALRVADASPRLDDDRYKIAIDCGEIRKSIGSFSAANYANSFLDALSRPEPTVHLEEVARWPDERKIVINVKKRTNLMFNFKN